MRASCCVLLFLVLCATASAQSEDLGKLTFSWVLLDKQQINFCNLAYANDKGSEFIVRPFKGERCTPKILAQVNTNNQPLGSTIVQPAATQAAPPGGITPYQQEGITASQPAGITASQPPAGITTSQAAAFVPPIIREVPAPPGHVVLAFQDGIVSVGGVNPDSVVVKQVARAAALNIANEVNRKLLL